MINGLVDQKLFEASYVGKGSRFYRCPHDCKGRASPIIVDIPVLEEAKKRLWAMPQRQFHSVGLDDCNEHNDFYLIDGGVVELHKRLNGVNYLGVWHESPIGIAYIAKKLELPSDGPRLE
jgi:hypothetical protein